MSMPRGRYIPKKIGGDPEDRFGFPVMVEAFLRDREVQGYSVETTKIDRSHLAHLVEWLLSEGVTHPGDVTKAMLEQYLQFLHDFRQPDGRPLLMSSQAARLGPVKQFYAWAVEHDRVARDPTLGLVLPRRERRLPRTVLSVAEVEKVMEQPDVSLDLGLRDRALMELLYSTGMRRGELARLQLEDLDRGRSAVMIRQAKGRKDRIVPVGARAMSWLDAYLAEVRPRLKPACANVFLSSEDGLGLSPARMSQAVRGYVDAAKIFKRGGCHMFRHTVATLMLDSGADIRHVQVMLGHSSLNSTQIYTHVSMTALAAVHARAFPDDRDVDSSHWPDTTSNVTHSFNDGKHARLMRGQARAGRNFSNATKYHVNEDAGPLDSPR